MTSARGESGPGSPRTSAGRRSKRLYAYWKTRAPGLELASMRAQLAALPAYLEPELAGSVSYVWGALSNACHHHTYELAPTAQELSLWAQTVERLMAATGKPAPS